MKKVIEKKDIADTDNEDNYIVLDKVSGNHKKADVYSLIKYVSKNSKDIAKIQAVIIEIDNALDTYKTIIEKKIDKLKKDKEYVVGKRKEKKINCLRNKLIKDIEFKCSELCKYHRPSCKRRSGLRSRWFFYYGRNRLRYPGKSSSLCDWWSRRALPP